jgi:hypothetical protein
VTATSQSRSRSQGNSPDPARYDGEAYETYDFIVCGAGSSGAVVAARLAENPEVRVLLGGFTNEVQHVECLSPAVARLASPVVHCFMIGAAVKGDPQQRGARAHP